MTVLVDLAAEGMAVYAWTQSAGAGHSPLEIGYQRALREEGGFSYRNTLIGEVDGRVAGMLVSYRLEDEEVGRDDMPPIFAPLADLEELVAGWWYLNVVAVFPQFRRRGLASAFLDHADSFAQETGAPGAALIAASGNAPALALYERNGYGEAARRPMVSYPGGPEGQDWLLLTKPLGK